VAGVLILCVIQLQLQHFSRFRHFIPFGLHADVIVRNADLGIAGITKTYEAKLTNYGIFPASVTVCDFIESWAISERFRSVVSSRP
jgi:hypothetical protein